MSQVWPWNGKVPLENIRDLLVLGILEILCVRIQLQNKLCHDSAEDAVNGPLLQPYIRRNQAGHELLISCWSKMAYCSRRMFKWFTFWKFKLLFQQSFKNWLSFCLPKSMCVQRKYFRSHTLAAPKLAQKDKSGTFSQNMAHSVRKARIKARFVYAPWTRQNPQA